MKENRLFYDALANGIRDIVIIVKVEEGTIFTYEFINKEARNRTTVGNHDIGKRIEDVVPADMVQFMLEKYREAAVSKEQIEYEDSYKRRLGKTYYTRTILTPLMDENNVCTHIVAVVEDITLRRQAEISSEASSQVIRESKDTYESLYEHNPDGIYRYDLTGKRLTGNHMAEVITGYNIQELSDTLYDTFVISEDNEEIKSHFKQAVAGKATNCDVSFYRRDGDIIKITIKFSPIIVQDEIVGVYGVFKDITEEYKLILKNIESENRFRIIAENSSDLILLIDEKGMISYVSPSCERILGYSFREYIGNHFKTHLHEAYQKVIQDTFWKSVENGEPWDIKFQQKHRTRGWIWIELNGRPTYDEQNQFSHMVAVARDITYRKQYEDKLEYLANHDILTGLPNRRYFQLQLKKSLGGKSQHDRYPAILMMDIDHFKSINDEKGHDIGDVVLREFARRLQQVIKPDYVAARLGGDEFVILIPEARSQDESIQLAKNIISAVHKPWLIEGEDTIISTSIGIVNATIATTDIRLLMKHVDLALYEAKDAGRNTFKVKRT
ncbi:diguanylate cyclase domain-containing protein [Virgibacillus soli]|uniref:Diguanylate cyclase n=1 Tax=Paracerasibacillus soli TaxID=480284 RepID=A0ABU5CUL8_9BACI|nr:diguanylate cyclase [Virgibacillus soli]MDY0409135.1 diguanylate cyclase [Virgibacillus soli]